MIEVTKALPKTCPDCGLLLPKDAPAGLCPVCLLRAALSEPADTSGVEQLQEFAKGAGPEAFNSDMEMAPDQPGTSITAIQSSEDLISQFPSPGSTLRYFGDYELHEEIAQGGMGVVYRARQVRLNRRVALKMIRAGRFSSGTEIQRLRVEAEAAAQLDHPAIVPVFEVGEHEGLHYFTMAFVDGETLSAKLNGGPMPARAAARLMQTVAEAVAYAHEKGVIHRDLKPGNILIDPSGQPRVSDFGLAKQVSSDNELTTTGQILGTPSYMPPEQALGKLDDVGRSSDIYSLGAVLYATLTGRPPFQAATSVETLRMVVEELPLAPRLLNPSTPSDLQTICLKCLEKSISLRYPSAKDVAEELGRFLSGDPIQARPAGRIRKLTRWYRRHWAVATSAISLLLTISVVVSVLALTASRLRSELAKTEKAQAAEQAANEDALGRLWIAYLNEANAQHRSRQSGQRFGALRAIRKAMDIPVPTGRSLDELRTAASAALCLPDLEVERALPHSSRYMQFAVDSRMTLFGVDDAPSRQFVVRDLLTDEIRMSVPTAEWRFDYQGASFSPDSQLLVYPKVVDGTSHLHLWRVGGNSPVADLGPDALVVAFEPDSLRCAVGHVNTLIRILDCRTFTELARFETGLSSYALGIAWNPRLPQLAVMDRSHWCVFDAHRGTKLSSHEVGEGLEGWPSWDPAGKRLSAGATNRRIGIWDSLTTELTVAPIRGHLNGGTIVRFSPDGNRIVSNDWSHIIRLWDTRTGQQLLSVPATGSKLQFSADGKHLVGDCGTSDLRIFRYEAGNEFRSIWEHAGVDSEFIHIHSVPCLNRTGRILAIRTPGGLCLIDLLRDEIVCRLPIWGNGPFRFHSTSSGECLWTYGRSGLLSWPIQVNNELNEATIGPPERIANIATENYWASSSDGEIVLVPTVDGGLLWNTKTRQQSLLSHPPDIRTCAVTPDGRIGVTGSHHALDAGVIVWDLKSHSRIAELPVRNGCVFISPDGKWLITNGGETRIWRVGEWKESRRLGSTDSLSCFSPDSQLVAHSGDISVIRLFQPETCQEVAVLTAPERTRLLPLAFTPDGARLISYGEETGALHIFDLRAIRKQLAEIELDWDFPPLPPVTESSPSESPLKFIIDIGTLHKMEQ